MDIHLSVDAAFILALGGCASICLHWACKFLYTALER